MPRIRRSRYVAFTAVEMIAVLALASLSSALTILSLTGPRNRSATDEVIDRIALCDELARHSAVRLHRPVSLMLDADRGLISENDSSPGDASAPPRVVYRLPPHCQIRQFVLHGGDSVAGSTEIPISASGISATYAMQLTDGRTTIWLIVSGFSGQLLREENEQQVFQTLGEMARPGDDAR